MRKVIIIGGRDIHNANSAPAARVMNYAFCLASDPDVNVYIASLDNDVLSDFKELRKGSGIYELPSKANPESPSISEIWKFLNSMKAKNDKCSEVAYLIYPSTNLKFEIIFILWCRLNKIKRVYCEINEVRKYWSALSNYSTLKKILYGVYFSVSERISKFYKGLICINKNIQDYYSVYNRNSIVIPILSYVTERYPSSVSSGSTLKLTFTGTIDIEKENLSELLKGLSLFDKKYAGDWNLDLYGYCTSTTSYRLSEMLNNLNISDKVFYKGIVAHKDIFKILSEADCLILPRCNNKQNYYGFSTKLSEYLVSGTPVILTRTGVVEEYLTDGTDCIFVDGYDAIGFQNALLRFAKLDISVRKSIAENGYNTAIEKFSPEKYTKQLVDFLFT